MDVVELSKKRREVDLCVPYEFDEERPWQLDLIVAPQHKVEYAGTPRAVYQILTVIHISELKDCQDLTYQVLLSHGERPVWLEGEVLMFIPAWAPGGQRPRLGPWLSLESRSCPLVQNGSDARSSNRERNWSWNASRHTDDRASSTVSGDLALSGIAVSAASRALGPPLGRIAGHGAHVRGNGDLQEL
jgi:hypothetical protein